MLRRGGFHIRARSGNRLSNPNTYGDSVKPSDDRRRESRVRFHFGAAGVCSRWRRLTPLSLTFFDADATVIERYSASVIDAYRITDNSVSEGMSGLRRRWRRTADCSTRKPHRRHWPSGGRHWGPPRRATTVVRRAHPVTPTRGTWADPELDLSQNYLFSYNGMTKS